MFRTSAHEPPRLAPLGTPPNLGGEFALVLSHGLIAQNPPANPNNLGNDANGNPLRKAVKTGHISNYDEAKVAAYRLPDPLLLSNGQRVRNADMWTKQRRAELIRLYETEIYGRVPANAPKVTWEVGDVDPMWRNGMAIRKRHRAYRFRSKRATFHRVNSSPKLLQDLFTACLVRKISVPPNFLHLIHRWLAAIWRSTTTRADTPSRRQSGTCS